MQSNQTLGRVFRQSWLFVLLAAAGTFVACGGGGSTALETPEASGGELKAPEFPVGHTWFNVPEPLSIQDLRGKAVLLDFWTLGCINCQHIIPDLKRLEDEFGDALVVIGVHSGKYDREHADQSVRDAIRKYGLAHPVVNDPDFVIWNAYGARAWPTLVLVDPAGMIVGAHEGEGVYEAVDPALSQVVDEFEARGEIDRTPIALDLESEGATSAVLSFPSTVLADEANGRLFIADAGNNRVLISKLDGTLIDVIGSGDSGTADGGFEEAAFRQPQGLALTQDASTLYISDTRNHLVRAVDLGARTVATIAGTGTQAGISTPSSPQAATETPLASPWGLLLHGRTLFIAMAGTHQIWTLDLNDSTVQVFAGNRREGIDDGPRLDSTLAQPSGLAADGTYLYWVDAESNSVRRVALEGEGNVETLTGTGLFDFGDVDGPPGTALLEHPQGIAYRAGVLYVADTYNHKVRAVDAATGQVSTVAGTGSSGVIDGDASKAQLNEPGGIAATSTTLYVADTNNNGVRVVDLVSRATTTLALSNLGVAVSGVESGRTLSAALEPQVIGPAASVIQLRISAPDGYHLNALAPSRLLLSTSNEPALAPLKDTVSFETDDQAVDLRVPIRAAVGNAVLSLRGEVYYCRDGQEGVCLIDVLDLVVPVTVAAGGGDAVTVEVALQKLQT